MHVELPNIWLVISVGAYSIVAESIASAKMFDTLSCRANQQPAKNTTRASDLVGLCEVFLGSRSDN